MKSICSKAWNNRFHILAILVVLLGITYRLFMFFQNRNLIIDEANVVRNVYERGFLGLLKPLSYEQYAAPLYMWTLELCSYIFGYSEKAMRLPALIFGVSAIFIYWQLLRKVMPVNSLWLPLGLLCFAPILVKYSAEVKQYVPDAFIAILLVLMALRFDLLSMNKRKFIFTWIAIGSIAIWASQPAVFILATVGIYYFSQVVLQKKWNLFPALLIIGLVWLAQFGVYYELILKTQINSDYLQNYHREYFLFGTPSNKEEWMHNWIRIKEILNNTSGYNLYSLVMCIIFIIIGYLALLRKSVSQFILLSFPVFITLVAAALNQFSLIERVAIFILPFTMLAMGYGFAQLMAIRFKAAPIAPLMITFAGLYILKDYNMNSLFRERFSFQEITAGFDYILSKNGTGKELYVDCASRDTYIYYTQIHPEKSKYAMLDGAYLFNWSDDNFPEVSSKVSTPRSFFIFTGGGSESREKHVNQVKENLTQTDYYEFAICYVFTFQKK